MHSRSGFRMKGVMCFFTASLASVILQLLVNGASPTSPSVIIVGAGMSGISAAKTLFDERIKDFLILEATNHIGGRMHKESFAGLNIELGANWVAGVNGEQVNPIWTLAKELKLKTFFSDFSNLSSNTYKQEGGLYERSVVKSTIDQADGVMRAGEKLSKSLPASGLDDISVLTMQRLKQHVPTTPVELVVDYFTWDYKFVEPPRVTSLQGTTPFPTFANFGEDVYFVADPRGYESVVYHIAKQFLKTTTNGSISDPRLKLNKVVRNIAYSSSGVTVTTEDGSLYKADYVMVSVSIGVLQTHLIKFQPDLPQWKILAMYQFDMALFTGIFLKFPYKFWPVGNGTEFFLYASERRGYYPIWQQLEGEHPGANVLFVIVTDDESRRIEQQPDSDTKAEAMEVLRKMFGNNIPEATDIIVPRWWSNRFYKGATSNWPIGVNRYEYDQIRAPVGKVYFTGEHTSTMYNGYVHGAYLAGIDSAKMLISCIKKGMCRFHIKPKNE